MSTKSIQEALTASFSRDECIILESFLCQYEMVVSNKNKASLKPLPVAKIAPICKLNKASYGLLRYKIEHIINPKSI